MTKKMHSNKLSDNSDGILRTAHGIPVADNQHSITAGKSGPTVLDDVYLVEKLAHFNRERIPERVVHAKGSGAYGYFEVANDLSSYTKAKLFSKVKKRTEVFVRFSTVAGAKGSADTVRDLRGFAIKFYTEDGNYDLVMTNAPVFFIRDGIKFPDLVHSQKQNPTTGRKDQNMAWDFFSLSPETIHHVMIIYSDRGIPASYANMNGYSGHTFKWVNEKGDAVWVKYHFKTDSKIKNMDPEDAERIAGSNPNFHREELYERIEKGEFPSWTVDVQIMPYEDAKKYRFNPFDITKVWPHKDYPLIELGKLVLNRNPKNFFAEVEESAFSPGNTVPGIEFSPDKLLHARIFAYADADRYRLGVNYTDIPVNKPLISGKNNYYQDGLMKTTVNSNSEVNYEPNSLEGPVESIFTKRTPYSVSGEVDNNEYEIHSDDNDFVQAGEFYRIMNPAEKDRLAKNIAKDLRNVRKDIVERQIELFRKVDASFGDSILKELGLP
ncbi:MAG: catalase [Thermoplasmataceae archaeon]